MNTSYTDNLPVQNRTFLPHLWRIDKITHQDWIVNLQSYQILITYWKDSTRKLTSMMRGLTIWHDGTTNGQKRNLSQKLPSGYSGSTPKRLSGRLRYRSALGFSFSFDCGAGVCLSRRAQRADLYKTSTRHGAKRQKIVKMLTSNRNTSQILLLILLWDFYRCKQLERNKQFLSNKA